MISLTTLLKLSHGLVVTVLVALASLRGDSRVQAMHAAVDQAHVAVAREARSSLLSVRTTPRRPQRVDRPPSSRDVAVSELEDDEDGLSAPIVRSVRVDLPRSNDVVATRGRVRIVVLVSYWMPTGHPRGPPAARAV